MDLDARQLHERLVLLLNEHNAEGAAAPYAEDCEFHSLGLHQGSLSYCPNTPTFDTNPI